MNNSEKQMTEEHYFCDLKDDRRIEFKSREDCLHYFRSHKDQIKPYGCGYWRWDQARNFILLDSILMDPEWTEEQKERWFGDYKSGTFLYW